MKLCIDKQAVEKSGITVGEFMLLLQLLFKADSVSLNNLINKGYITKDYDIAGQWRLTNKGKQLIDDITADSEPVTSNEEDALITLAKRLKEIFPKGKKDGTNYYWADGVALIVRRLKLFFKKYGDTYNHDQIIQAAEKYVAGFKGSYRYMQLLKYFIFKEKVGAAGEVEGESQLVNYVENAGQEENLSNDWTGELR